MHCIAAPSFGPPSKACAWHSNTLTGIHDRWHVRGSAGARLSYEVVRVPPLLLTQSGVSGGKMATALIQHAGCTSR